jgi:mRNA interferase MazF
VKRGEVWVVDLGLAAKVRPCLLLTDYPRQQEERMLITVLPHTTAVRGSPWEIALDKPFLKRGAFDTQQIQSLSTSAFVRRIGALTPSEMAQVADRLRHRLSL